MRTGTSGSEKRRDVGVRPIPDWLGKSVRRQDCRPAIRTRLLACAAVCWSRVVVGGVAPSRSRAGQKGNPLDDSRGCAFPQDNAGNFLAGNIQNNPFRYSFGGFEWSFPGIKSSVYVKEATFRFGTEPSFAVKGIMEQPEPSTIALRAGGLGMVVYRLRRKSRQG